MEAINCRCDLVNALENLKPQERTLVLKFVVEGYSYEDLATETSVSTREVAGQILEAISILRWSPELQGYSSGRKRITHETSWLTRASQKWGAIAEDLDKLTT